MGYGDRWTGFTPTQGWLFTAGGTLPGQQSVEFSFLVDTINGLTAVVKSKIAILRSKRSAMSIADMFDLQMAMNKLSQFSEMSTSLITGMNTAVLSMSRNMKG